MFENLINLHRYSLNNAYNCLAWPKIAYNRLQLLKAVSNFLNLLKIAYCCLQLLNNERTTAQNGPPTGQTLPEIV